MKKGSLTLFEEEKVYIPQPNKKLLIEENGTRININNVDDNSQESKYK
jgi:hypothetical protein